MADARLMEAPQRAIVGARSTQARIGMAGHQQQDHNKWLHQRNQPRPAVAPGPEFRLLQHGRRDDILAAQPLDSSQIRRCAIAAAGSALFVLEILEVIFEFIHEPTEIGRRHTTATQ